ncbi:alpha/beta hydrolase-fold protein [Spongiimicrobium salis]|uniref:alpha/beta hydrolase-fold protein n=1 Tax=Spongiimicrobium salis TaxID=1667022 RepID=UPI00374DA4B7
MKSFKICFLLLYFVHISSLQGQDHPAGHQFSFTTTIPSTFLNEVRPFRVQLPTSYYQNKAKKYPVLYVLDAKNLEKHTIFIHDYLSQKGHIPEMIIVSIPHTGQRDRDYKTFFRDSDKVNEGANHFLNFIANEVIPFMAKNYRTNDYRILSGHSNSGLFVIHSLIKRPDLFKARFAFSPSSHHIPKQRELLAKTFQKHPDLKTYFYMNVGGAEFYKMRNAFKEVKNIFETHAPEGLRYDFDFSTVDGHQTTPFIGQHLAFKKLYAPHKLQIEDYESMTFLQLLAHFDKTSAEFGYTVIPSERELGNMGNYYVNFVPNLNVLKNLIKWVQHYHPNSALIGGNSSFYENWLTYGIAKKNIYTAAEKPDEDVVTRMGRRYASEGQYEKAIFLLELALGWYPESSFVYNNLGSTHEKLGDFKKALKMHRKALALAKKTDKGKEKIQLHLKNIEKIKERLVRN